MCANIVELKMLKNKPTLAAEASIQPSRSLRNTCTGKLTSRSGSKKKNVSASSGAATRDGEDPTCIEVPAELLLQGPHGRPTSARRSSPQRTMSNCTRRNIFYARYGQTSRNFDGGLQNSKEYFSEILKNDISNYNNKTKQKPRSWLEIPGSFRKKSRGSD